ncbi:hypothetical protein FANTH_8191 [Fusarium anthophilum]|uniref:Uncharacterized protein n=1 Tax=Fusarium anthophilum TaxID=48485 RepID=A0A8H4ZBG2_9HYPO|nr:hypothetical protein FANTH_8191 [Fusarium anthophilum]
MFLISRSIIGFDLVFANAYALMLIGKLAHPKGQQVITSLCQTSWYIGAILAAWMIFGTFSNSWRIPSLLQAAPSLLPITCVFAFPSLLDGSAQMVAVKNLFNEYHNTAAGKATIAMLFPFYFFYNLAFNPVHYSYHVEVLAYSIRAKSLASHFFGIASNFISTTVNPIALQILAWKFYFIYVTWLTIELAIVWKLLVRGPSLEAIAAAFEGHTTAVEHDSRALKQKKSEEDSLILGRMLEVSAQLVVHLTIVNVLAVVSTAYYANKY